jgi:hypothetical protein
MPEKEKNDVFTPSPNRSTPQKPTPAQEPKKAPSKEEEKNRDSHLDYNRGS